MYSMLHGIEKLLSDQNESGIIISDNSDIKTPGGTPLLSRLLEERIEWRFGASGPKTVIPNFKYESMSCFLLDGIHFVDSKKSLFSQIVDIVLYVTMRVLYFSFLLKFEAASAKIELVPISPLTFNYFTDSNLYMAVHNTQLSDVVLTSPIDFHKDNERTVFKVLNFIW